MNIEQNLDRVIKQATVKIANVADVLVNDLQIKNDDVFLVGGFVRDTVLSEIFNVKNESKDIDIILPTKPDFTDNKNIISQKQNSLGGIKVKTTSFPEIDIFQQHVDNPQTIVGGQFDLNCNAIYYSHKQKQIFPSVYFDYFLYNEMLDIEHVIYDGSIKTLYSVPSLVSRALKFQILFRQRYGFETRLSNNLLWLIYNMDKDSERAMREYTKIKSAHLQKQIFQSFQQLRK